MGKCKLVKALVAAAAETHQEWGSTRQTWSGPFQNGDRS